jgi:xyloglucan 6-xylosyltransferase
VAETAQPVAAYPSHAASAPQPSERKACGRAPPRVLLVTAEQPTECSTATAQWLAGRSMRNRLQYAQRHGWQLYWNSDVVDPQFPGILENAMWNKPMLLSKLLSSNMSDGVEWLFWIDSDAIFMDLDFELPLDEYLASGTNLVLWVRLLPDSNRARPVLTPPQGESRMVDEPFKRAPSYFGLNAGVMLLRNSAWTRDFLSEILAAGADIAGSTAVQGALLKGMCDRAYDCVVSDQSTIVYLLHTQPEKWRKTTVFEKRFTMNGHWAEYAGHLTSGSLRLKDSIWSSDRVPFVMHFAGCQLCSGAFDPLAVQSWIFVQLSILNL